MTRRRAKRSARATRKVDWSLARAVLAKHATRLLRRTGVVGVDLGIKRSEGVLVPGPCIRVHVAKKLPDPALSSRRRFPKAIEGVPIDVVESTFKSGACPDTALPHRLLADPLVGGTSIGRFGESSFGTLGVIIMDDAGDIGGLTCAHVCRAGDTVVQPHELGPPIGVVTAEAFDETVDAAHITLGVEDRAVRPEVLNFGAVDREPREVAPEDLPLAVDMAGACSGRTHGFIISTSFQGWLDDPNGRRRARDVLCIEPDGAGVFCRQGDSGAGIFHAGHLVGQIIAAGSEELGGVGLAVPIKRVFAALRVSLP